MAARHADIAARRLAATLRSHDRCDEEVRRLDTLDKVDWNAEIIQGDLADTVRKLKQQPGGPILTGGVQLPLTLAELGLIDEYELIVQPVIAGHGPTLFAGLSAYAELKLIDSKELDSGTVVLRYEPRR